LAAPRLFAATAAENHAIQVATEYFDGKFYGQAEKEFGNFVRAFTNSTRLPEAILFQAEARFEQTNYAGAIELLSAQLNTATNWTDQYLFWIAEANFKQGNYSVAADGFAKLIKDFPASSRRLEAGIEEAGAKQI